MSLSKKLQYDEGLAQTLFDEVETTTLDIDSLGQYEEVEAL